MDATPPENSRGVVFSIGTRRYPKLEKGETLTQTRAVFGFPNVTPPPPKFKIAPKQWWLEDDPFLLGFGNFSGAS